MFKCLASTAHLLSIVRVPKLKLVLAESLLTEMRHSLSSRVILEIVHLHIFILVCRIWREQDWDETLRSATPYHASLLSYPLNLFLILIIIVVALGECWSGAEAAGTFARAGYTNQCVTMDYKECNPADKIECAGTLNTNFVYGIGVQGTYSAIITLIGCAVYFSSQGYVTMTKRVFCLKMCYFSCSCVFFSNELDEGLVEDGTRSIYGQKCTCE